MPGFFFLFFASQGFLLLPRWVLALVCERVPPRPYYLASMYVCGSQFHSLVLRFSSLCFVFRIRVCAVYSFLSSAGSSPLFLCFTGGGGIVTSTELLLCSPLSVWCP